MSLVRQSKFRHVFGTALKEEFCYKEIKPNNNAWDSNYIDANLKYWAISWKSGGGALAVVKHSATGRVSADTPLLAGHTGPILDFRFHPFNTNIVATGSEDSTVKIWGIPEGGLTETINTPLVTLDGHSRKVCGVEFSHVANNVLATAAFDFKLKLWDVEQGQDKVTVEGFKDAIQSMSWNLDGSLLATTCKDKNFRIVDPRAAKFVSEAPGHPGVRGSRVSWFKNKDIIFTVGFGKMSERCYSIWDPRNADKPLLTNEIDVSAGLLMPFYDEDTSILYLAGKGDGNIRYYEVVNKEPYIHHLATYSTNNPQNGMCMLPKLACDTSICEVTRLYKLEPSVVTPVMFQVPRKESSFQEDLYPDTAAPEPVLTSEEWFSGASSAPKLISMRNAAEYANTPKMSEFTPKVEAKKQEPKVVLSNDPKVLQKQVLDLQKEVEALKLENEALKAKLGQ